MNARLEQKLRTLAVIVVAGTAAGLVVTFLQGRTSGLVMVAGAIYGLLMGLAIGVLELFVLGGPMRDWLSGLSFTVNLMVRSAIYAAIIMAIQLLQDEFVAGLAGISGSDFWSGVVTAAGVSVAIATMRVAPTGLPAAASNADK